MTSATTVTRSGVRLCYDTIGNPRNQPLLLIQGLGAQLLGWHHDFCSQLADAGFFVIRHDNRDAGLSQKFPAGGYTITDMARDSAELITALGLPPAHVVGQSMGGMIAQEVAIAHPATVRSLTLIYTAAHPGHILADAVGERMDLPRARNRAEAIELFLRNEAPCATPGYPHDEAWLRELGGLMYDRHYEPATTQRQLAAIYRSPDRRPALPGINAPTAILHGDSDNLIDPAAAKELHDLIPGSTLTIYPGMGHVLPRELWNDFVTKIQDNSARTPAFNSPVLS
jgi:pimeloyl-ACP methyl ester carboxylesterase